MLKYANQCTQTVIELFKHYYPDREIPQPKYNIGDKVIVSIEIISPKDKGEYRINDDKLPILIKATALGIIKQFRFVGPKFYSDEFYSDENSNQQLLFEYEYLLDISGIHFLKECWFYESQLKKKYESKIVYKIQM